MGYAGQDGNQPPAPYAVNADRDLVIDDWVYVQGNKKRGPIPLKGKEAVVIKVLGRGTVFLEAPGSGDPPTRLQQKFTTLLRPARDAPPALVPPVPAPAVAQPSAAHLPAPAPKAASEPSSAVLSPGKEAASGLPQTEREMLQVVRSQMMDDEAEVPWDAVHSFWRSRRSRWRQATAKADKVAEMAQRVLEYRSALLLDGGPQRCGMVWKQAVDACAMGQGTAAQLLQVWRELRVSIETWLQARDQPSGATLQESRVHASAMWAVQAMQDAIRLGDDALVQVPLEAILNYDSDSLLTIKALMEKQQRFVIGRLTPIENEAEVTKDENGRIDVGHDSEAKPTTRSKTQNDDLSAVAVSADHFTSHDDFDSSAETEEEEGSQVTDMSDSD